jgi:predicted O-methyltransferase YrrM
MTFPPKHYKADQPWLPEFFISILEKVLADIPDARVFEWGAGGSTIWFAQRVREVVTVEANPTWAQFIRDRAAKQDLKNIVVLEYDYETPYYAKCINKIPKQFDLIFVDGKNRRACAERAIVKVRRGGWVLFDNSNAAAHEDDIKPLLATKWDSLSAIGSGVGGTWECRLWRKPL